MFLRKILPDDLGEDAKEVVRMTMGLIVLVTALVLGLFVASAKNAYDTQNAHVRQMTANVILLDVLLARYGPDADTARHLLRPAIVTLADRLWQVNGFEHAEDVPFHISASTDAFNDMLWELSPSTEPQRAHKARAIEITTELTQTRLLLLAMRTDSVPTAFLVVLMFWLTIIFASFGLFAQPSPVVIVCLFVSAMSVAGAIYLILDLGQPFSGMIQIPSTPLRNALAPL